MYFKFDIGVNVLPKNVVYHFEQLCYHFRNSHIRCGIMDFQFEMFCGRFQISAEKTRLSTLVGTVWKMDAIMFST